jgi:hypothetical protein
MRPSWGDVYDSHPLHNTGTLGAEELTLENEKWSTHRIFAHIFKKDYNAKANTYGGRNAGATRLSIALIESGVKLRRDFLTKASDLAERGFIASVREVHAWLSTPTPDGWGNADIIIPGGSTLAEVAQRIGARNGVYIVLNDNHEDDVATLWEHTRGDVIEGKNNIDKGGTIYFWELKGEAGRRNSFVKSLNVLHLIFPDAPKSGFIEVAGEKIFVDYYKQDFFKEPAAYRKGLVKIYTAMPPSMLHLRAIEEHKPEIHQKLASGKFHYIYVPEYHRPGERYRDGGDYFAFAFYHELAHILHPEGVARNEQGNDENIRSEYVADEAAVAKLGWGADEYRQYISSTFNNSCIQDMVGNENRDVSGEYTQEKYHCHARSQLLKSLERDW